MMIEFSGEPVHVVSVLSDFFLYSDHIPINVSVPVSSSPRPPPLYVLNDPSENLGTLPTYDFSRKFAMILTTIKVPCHLLQSSSAVMDEVEHRLQLKLSCERIIHAIRSAGYSAIPVCKSRTKMENVVCLEIQF